MSYIQLVRELLDRFEAQTGPIDQAADLICHAMLNKGVIYCHGIGHGNEGDFLHRAGGLAAVQPFTFSFAVNAPVPACLKDRPGARPVEQDLAVARLAVDSSNMRSGDVLLLGSVSGKNRVPIEVAMACRDIGVKVIAFTSPVYTAQVESLHPSGKKLCDVADVVIDNGAPYGDAACDIPGLDVPALPLSGTGATIAGWMIWEAVMRKMIEKGEVPTVFMSFNREGGVESHTQKCEQYDQRGY